MSNSDEIRWQQRLENFGKALKQLEAGCAQTQFSDLERAGLVQVFSFTFELGWKTLKDLLYYEGFDTKSPRETIRQAFQAGYLDEANTETFLDALQQRNLLAHIYDKEKSLKAEDLIRNQYAPVLQSLYATLNGRRHV